MLEDTLWTDENKKQTLRTESPYTVQVNSANMTQLLVKPTDEDYAEDPAAYANKYYYDEAAGKIYFYLGDLAAADHPVITYSTKVVNYDHTAVNQTTQYSNTVKLSGGGIQDSTSTDTQNVVSEVLEKEKGPDNYDAVNKLLSWKLTINKNAMDLGMVTITDTIPAGQAYEPGTLKLGATPLDNATYEFNQGPVNPDNPAGPTWFSFILDNVITQQVVTFKTRVTDMSVFVQTNGTVTFKNSASLVTSVNSGNTVEVKDIPQTVTNTPLTKEAALVDKDEGFIRWKVTINPRQAVLGNDVWLEDQLVAGLSLDIDSVELYPYTLDGSGTPVQGSTKVALGSDDIEYDYTTRLFRLHLPAGASGYVLYFNTDVDKDSPVSTKYINEISMSGTGLSGDIESETEITITGTMNGWITGTSAHISITKKDVATGDPILNNPAEFELLDSHGNVITTAETDPLTGIATFGPLKLRQFYIRETAAPTGYAVDPTLISADLRGQAGETIALESRDALLTTSVPAYKVNANGSRINGGTFALYRWDDSGNGSWVDTTKRVSAARVEGENGVILFTGLEVGRYQIREIRAPGGYKKTSEVLEFTVTLNLEGIELEYEFNEREQGGEQPGELIPNDTLINTRAPGGGDGAYVTLTKTDALDGKRLEGAHFALYDADGYFVATAVTDASGYARFTDVPNGKYTIKEIQAPYGYWAGQTPITGNANGGYTSHTVPNTQLSMMPKTGDAEGILGLVLVGGALALLGVALARKRRENA